MLTNCKIVNTPLFLTIFWIITLV